MAPRGGGKPTKRITAPTMSDVARRAGVSAMTVSRALRHGASIAAPTRQNIMKAVEELGYVLDQSAGSLSSKRTGFVAALIPSINNSNFADTIRGLTEILEPAGLQLLLGTTDYGLEKEDQLIESMLRRRPEAMVITGGRHTLRGQRLLERSAIPVIETWDLPGRPVNHVVGFSNAEASAELVRHLHAKGYRRIGFIGGTTNRDSRGADRRQGYEQAMADLKLKSHVISFGTPPISMEQGAEAIVRLVAEWPEAEATICVSDLSAFGALSECHRRGWAVPGRIAIAGFGNFEISSQCHPRLTTVGVNCLEIGRRAGALLLRAIATEHKERPLHRETHQVAYTVIAREST